MKRQRKLEKHPNGQYRVRISREGVSKSFFLGRNEKDARRQLKQIEQDIAVGNISFTEQETSSIKTHDGKRDMRVEELAVNHLEWVKIHRSESTFDLRQRYILQFLDFIGPCMVSDITRVKLENYYAQEKKNGGKPNSGNHQLREVKTMLLWGEEMELIDLPFRKFPVIRNTPPKTKRVNEGDLVKLLPHLAEDFKDMILFDLMTGLRPKEIRELTKSKVLFNQEGKPYVYIEGHKSAELVGESTPRTVPLCSKAAEIVERQRKAHPNSDHIFLNNDGTPYSRSVFRNRLIRGCRRAKIEPITPYALRHTFASMESDAGVETTSLSKLMGHSETRTLKRYVTNSFESHHNAVEKVEARLDKIIGA
jgi:integrase